MNSGPAWATWQAIVCNSQKRKSKKQKPEGAQIAGHVMASVTHIYSTTAHLLSVKPGPRLSILALGWADGTICSLESLPVTQSAKRDIMAYKNKQSGALRKCFGVK